MVSSSNVKFYKSNNNGLGGGIDTSAEIVLAADNNLFSLVTKAQADAGITRYRCMYIKNLNTETINKLTFREFSGTRSSETNMEWAKGIAGKNGSEPSIGSETTAPSGSFTWRNATDNPEIEIADFAQNDRYGIWFKNTINAGTNYQKNDQSVFKVKCPIPAGGTGETPDEEPGGSGGNPAPTPSTWKIAVCGDWGCEGNTDEVMDMCESYDKVINVGDNAYESAGCWKSKVDNHGLKSKMLGCAYGNHEYSDGSPSDYKTYFGHSKTYFMKTFQNVGVITIDSNDEEDSDAPSIDSQKTDVTNWLNSLNANPAINWIFVTFHHPMFGSHSDHEYNEADTVQKLHTLFTSKKVAFVFCGHNHNWQATGKVTYNSGNPTDPNTTDSASPFTNDTNGFIHVICGTGGHDGEGSLYPLEDAIGEGDNPNIYQSRSHLGIFEIVASNAGKTLTCSFVDRDLRKYNTFTYTATLHV